MTAGAMVKSAKSSAASRPGAPARAALPLAGLPRARQGELDASVSARGQSAFGLSEATVFVLEGAGVTLFSASLLATEGAGMLAGLLVTLAAIGLLFVHLGHPTRAWRVLAGWRHSWISRGALALALFALLGLVNLFLWDRGALRAGSALAGLMATLQVALGAFILVYPAGLLQQSAAIPFWRGDWFRAMQVLSGLASGGAWFLVILAAAREEIASELLWVQFGLLDLLLISVAAHLAITSAAPDAARASLHHLAGKSGVVFGLAGCVLGIGIPVGLTLAPLVSAEHAVAFLAIAAGARTVGDVALRHSLLTVGMYDPIC